MVVRGASIWHILPYQHTHAVAVEIPAVCLDFAMLAQHVKAKILHSPDIIDQCLIAGCCVKSVWPVALIQNTALEIRLIIEEKARISVLCHLNITFPESKIGKDLVFSVFNGHWIQPWLLGRPVLLVLGRNRDGNFFSRLKEGFGDSLPAKLLCHAICIQKNRLVNSAEGRILRELCTHSDLHMSPVKIRSDPQIQYVGLWHDLHPYSLPDAALRCVKHTAAFQPLFAPCVVRGVAEIVDADQNGNNPVFPHEIGNIRRKRKVSSLVVGGKSAVNIDAADLVHSSKMKKEPLARRIKAILWQLNNPGIPQGFIRKQLSVHLGQRRFRGKRNQDLSVKRKIFIFVKLPGQDAAVCDQIIPHSVQIDPASAHHGGAGIFLQCLPVRRLAGPDCIQIFQKLVLLHVY